MAEFKVVLPYVPLFFWMILYPFAMLWFHDTVHWHLAKWQEVLIYIVVVVLYVAVSLLLFVLGLSFQHGAYAVMTMGVFVIFS